MPALSDATCIGISRPATRSVSAQGITAKAPRMNVNPMNGATMKNPRLTWGGIIISFIISFTTSAML